MAKRQGKLKEFQVRLEGGEEKTVNQWAEELFEEDTQYNRMRVMTYASVLRRRKGVMAFPIKVNGPKEPSVVKIVTRDKTLFMSAVNRHASQHVEPSIAVWFGLAERLITEHPKLKEQVIPMAKHLLDVASGANRTLLGIKFEPSNKMLSNAIHQGTQDKRRKKA